MEFYLFLYKIINVSKHQKSRCEVYFILSLEQKKQLKHKW